MNGVIGMVELLADTPPSQQQRPYLGTVASSASTLLAILDEVLDFSKVEAGKLDLHAVAEQVVLLFGSRAAEAGYDVILMDATMPELDGFEATRLLRRHKGLKRKSPVIAVTALALSSDRERCLEAGMDDYLQKPITRRAVAEALGRFPP